MFTSSPFYRSYNPYQPQPYPDLNRARVLAAQRAKRAQWLPDEYDDDDEYNFYQLNPHERAYLNAHRNHASMERERQQREQEIAEARRRELEELKWQQELDKRQREDQGVRRRLEVENERRRQLQQQQQRAHSKDRSTSPKRIIPISTTDSLVPSPRPQSEQMPETAAQQPNSRQGAPQYNEQHVEAASTLQRYFRIRKSIRLIQSLSSEFTTLRRNFSYPSLISFQKFDSSPSSSDVIDVTAVSPSTDDSLDVNPDIKISKLAFNSTNYPLLAYNEALDKLLVKLDGVESWGDSAVRTRRREVVTQIEGEQLFVERLCRTSWLSHIKEQGEGVDGDMPGDLLPVVDTPITEVGMEKLVEDVNVDLPTKEGAKQ